MFLFGGDMSPVGSDDFDTLFWQGFYNMESYSGVPDTIVGTSHRRAPTHTEDGIPIRKIYVSNLPYKTTRTEVFEVFAQYGFIKSCWVKMVDRSSNMSPYGFITFTDPADAHKALLAPNYKHSIRGRFLRVSPADSWHQPIQDAAGNVIWNNNKRSEKPDQSEHNSSIPTQQNSNNEEAECSNSPQDTTELDYNILDVLNSDCLSHIMSFLSIRDLIICEGVSKRWMALIQDYFQSFRCFRTSSWNHRNLTTAQLRHLLQRFGSSLTSLHIDEHYLSLNDRTAHTIGKFCPNLESLYVMGMYTKNWKPVIYSCKNLQSISFYECEKIDDSSLSALLGPSSPIESVLVSSNLQVTGKFLDNPSTKLHTLSLHHCNYIKAAILTDTLSKITNLKSLNLSRLSMAVWRTIPGILSSLLRLEELHLCHYYNPMDAPHMDDAEEELHQALEKLTNLKILAMSKNDFVNDKLLQRVSKGCTKLRTLIIAGCSHHLQRESSGGKPRVTNAGLTTLARNCSNLQTLDISYLKQLDEGVGALSGCKELRQLYARKIVSLTDASLIQCISGCHLLQEVDICGCESITEAVVTQCVSALEQRPRPFKLALANTSALGNPAALPKHRMLTLKLHQELVYHKNTPLIRDTMNSDDYNTDDSMDDDDDDDYDDLFYDEDPYSDYGLDNDDDDDFDDEDQWHMIDNMLDPEILQQLRRAL